jgi:hypothetical protein
LLILADLADLAIGQSAKSAKSAKICYWPRPISNEVLATNFGRCPWPIRQIGQTGKLILGRGQNANTALNQ